MVDKICTFLTNRIRKEMPDIDDERAEVINYGIQIIFGEIPKIFIMLAVALVLGIFKETLISFLFLIPYRGTSGGFHAKTHIGCILTTCIMYCGVAFLSKYIILTETIKYITIGIVWIFGMIMIKLYAPADTEDVPILALKDRKKKRIVSYISFTIGLILAMVIKDNIISNILLFGNFVQTLTITKLAYKLSKNKYGYEVYGKASSETV